MITRLHILFLCFILCSYALQAQPVKQLSSGKGRDMQIYNNGYTIYCATADLVAAINYVDAKTGEDHKAAIQVLQQGKAKKLDLQHAPEKDVVAAALKKAAGAWLVYSGRTYVELNGQHVKQVVAEAAPEMMEMDGTMKRTIFFSEPGNSTAIFCGDISSKVATP